MKLIMGYQSRKRNIKSRREKYQETVRNTRLVFLFLGIGLAVYFLMNRHSIWAYLKTYFY
ncbi:hypothetical protein [Phaeodactylibacter luteus]|uniref:Uncharacterized protein n=1 Tax=Phaeodactylibacter luteus TaxID=1564516 RepID=A0A5C6RIK1_9BACT|nr:hypothetical protein [Phaeodactylibacter luteus]TXB61799.1 hypothetical protein FRY97_17385 [Phaeodactylibacter luteus]